MHRVIAGSMAGPGVGGRTRPRHLVHTDCRMLLSPCGWNDTLDGSPPQVVHPHIGAIQCFSISEIGIHTNGPRTPQGCLALRDNVSTAVFLSH